MSATSIFCASRVEEAGGAEENQRSDRSGRAESEKVRPNEANESVIRATLAAFVAEKRKARKHFEEGNRHFAKAEFDKALNEFRRALKLCPRDPEYRKAVEKAELALGMRPTR